jgi:hypothetical protein
MLNKEQIEKLNKNASYEDALPICNSFILNFENHLKGLTEEGKPIASYYTEKIAIGGVRVISETVNSFLQDFFTQRGYTYDVVETSFSSKEYGLSVWLKITVRW